MSEKTKDVFHWQGSPVKYWHFLVLVNTLCLQLYLLRRALNELKTLIFRPPIPQIYIIFQEEGSLCHGILFGSSPLTGRGSSAVRQSIVKDIIMDPLLSPDKSSIIDSSPLQLGRMWPCHPRPISQPLDFRDHVTVQH